MKRIGFSVMAFMIMSAALYPAYKGEQKGFLISIVIGIAVSVMLYFTTTSMKKEAQRKENKFYACLGSFNKNQIDTIHQLKEGQKEIRSLIAHHIDEEKEGAAILSDYLSRAVSEIDRVREAMFEQNNELMIQFRKVSDSIKDIEEKEEKTNQVFLEKSSVILDIIKEELWEINKAKADLLERQELAVKRMIDTASDNKKLFQDTAEKLSIFTDTIAEVFEKRIDNEYRAINETRVNIASSLDGIKQLVGKVEAENSNHLNSLEHKYEELFILFSSSQQTFHNKLAKQVEELKNMLQETVESSGDDMKDILKKQSRSNEETISMVKDIQRDIYEQIKAQTERYTLQLEDLRELREELMNLNAVDVELIGKMLNGK